MCVVKLKGEHMSRLVYLLTICFALAAAPLRAEETACKAFESVAFTGQFLDTIPQATRPDDLEREINRLAAAISTAEQHLAISADAITPTQKSTIDGFLDNLRYAMLLARSTPNETLISYLARPIMLGLRASIIAMVAAAGCTESMDRPDVTSDGQTGAENQLAGIGTLGRIDSTASQTVNNLKLLLTPSGALMLFMILAIVALMLFAFIRRDKRKRRRARRYYCQAASAIGLGATVAPTTIVDISRVGAKINAVPALKPHSNIKLMVHTEWSEGKVIWANEHFAGIAFAKALSRVQIRNVVAQPSAVKAPFNGKKGSTRPGTAFSRNA